MILCINGFWLAWTTFLLLQKLGDQKEEISLCTLTSPVRICVCKGGGETTV